MPEPDFRIKYEGGEADQHMMDMRLLATSILGADRVVSDGLIVLTYRRLPRRGERAPVIAKVREPQTGSVELITFFGAILGTLNLGLPLAQELASTFIEEWWKAVIGRFSKKDQMAERAIAAMLELNRDHLASRDMADARVHDERMAYADVLRVAVNSQGRSIQQFAAPVGPAVSQATIFPVLANPVTVGSEEADAIRDSLKLVWGELEEVTLRTEGFRFHTNGLSIENPERDGYLMARVRDPRFDEPLNPYTEAAQRRASVVVLARKGRREGVLVELEIVDLISSAPSL